MKPSVPADGESQYSDVFEDDEQRSPVTNASGSARGAPDEPPSLPAGVLVETLTQARRITVLDASSVPIWLMVEPIDAALATLEAHGKHCRNPMQCKDTPGPLRPLLRMRPAARNRQREQVHSALWRFPSSRLVEWVREAVASRHQDLVEEINSGALFDRDELRTQLQGLDIGATQTLAAVLWSTGFDDSRASDLFKVLPAFVPVPGETAESDESAGSDTVARGSTEKARHRDKRLALEREVAELKKELEVRDKERRERAEQLADVKRDRDETRERLTATCDRLRELERALNESVELARSTEARLRAAERVGQQSSEAAAAYRRDLDRLRDELVDAEDQRTTFVRRLATAHTRIQELEAQLVAVPRGKQAVADYLAREEQRLRELEHTLEGGARARILDEKRLRRKLETAFLEAYPEFKQDRPPTIGTVRSLRFRALGGGSEVGRSAYLVGIGPHDVLVDCGIAVGGRREEDQAPDLSHISDLDALLGGIGETRKPGRDAGLRVRAHGGYPNFRVVLPHGGGGKGFGAGAISPSQP